MKKLTVLALFSISIIACKKEPKTITKIDPTTGDTIKIEVASEEDSVKMVEEIKEKAAIKDSAGIYKQGFKLEKGKTYPFTTYQKQKNTLAAPNGEKETITSEGTDVVSFTVNDLVDGVYDMTINFVSKKTSQTAQGKTLTVDTKQAAPKEESLKNQWTLDKAMIDNKLNMKMDENGKIISITGFDPVYAKFSKVINGLTKESKVREGLLKKTKAGFNEEVLKEQFSKNIMILPAKGAKIGEKWIVHEPASADGKIKVTTNYTLKKVENGVAEISVTGGIPKQSDKDTKEGITHTMNSEFSQNGSLKFDINTGWIINQNIKIKATQKETYSDGKQTETMSSVNDSEIIVNP